LINKEVRTSLSMGNAVASSAASAGSLSSVPSKRLRQLILKETARVLAGMFCINDYSFIFEHTAALTVPVKAVSWSGSHTKVIKNLVMKLFFVISEAF
jgi:hypothetical protein